jgi:uncharacterized membrane protein (Fun14 family)
VGTLRQVGWMNCVLRQLNAVIFEANYLRCVVKVFRIRLLQLHQRCVSKFWRKSKLQNFSNREQSMTITGALNNISVGKKLAAAFASVVILAIILAVVGINTLRLYHDQSLIVAAASSVELSLLNARVAEKISSSDDRKSMSARQYCLPMTPLKQRSG